MALINEIVDVTITRDITVSRPGFGTLLFIVPIDAFPAGTGDARIRSYASAAAVAADFPDPAVPASPTAAENINLAVQNMAVNYFTQTIIPESLIIGLKLSTDADYAAALDAMVLVNNDFYAIAMMSRVVADQEDAAGWVNDNAATNKKIIGFGTNDPNALIEGNTDNIIYKLINTGADGVERAFVLWHSKAYVVPGVDNVNLPLDEWAEVVWFGAVLPYNPGSINWMFRSLGTNVTVDTTLSLTGPIVLAINGNIYEKVGGVAITREGTNTSSSKDYIDNIRGLDWLVSEMQVNVYTLLVNSLKVPYTGAGISAIEAKIKETLALGVIRGVLSSTPAPTTTVPDILDVPAEDKVARTLNSVEFAATLSGAINKVKIQGRITV